MATPAASVICIPFTTSLDIQSKSFSTLHSRPEHALEGRRDEGSEDAYTDADGIQLTDDERKPGEQTRYDDTSHGSFDANGALRTSGN